MEKSNYYVYLYIDPRNFEEFYYGKGKGSRKNSHLSETTDTEKVRRIQAIKKAGLEPIIKVVAKDLTEREAFMIEKTLIWKLGRNLTNISSGFFADKFRPHNSYHLDLQGFDYEHGLYYVNVGEGGYRSWKDCKDYGFLSAGQGKQWSDQIRTLNPNDVVVAYLRGKGYVGIGRVKEKAVATLNFRFKGKSLKEYKLEQPGIFENCDNERSEYLVKIDWVKALKKEEAKWKKKSHLFTTQLVKATLDKQVKTIVFIEKEFGIKIKDLFLL